MKKKEILLIGKIKEWFLSHKTTAWVASLLVTTVAGWLFGWIMPSPHVVASNIPQKELTCILTFSQKLIQKHTSDSKLQITYDGKPVDDPHVFSISIQNTGDLAISNEDFKKDFVVEFRDCENILSAQISKSSSQYVAEEVLSNGRIDGENLIISDFFLNPNESFSVSVVTNKAPSVINYDARISDISSLSLRNTPKEKRTFFRNLMAGFLIIVAVIVSIFAIVEHISYKRFRKKLESEFTNDNAVIESQSGN